MIYGVKKFVHLCNNSGTGNCDRSGPQPEKIRGRQLINMAFENLDDLVYYP